VATTSGGIDGRPRPEGNKSSNISAGNNRDRCSARNPNTLPAGNRCPATESTSKTSRWESERPCMSPGFQQSAASAGGAPLFSRLLGERARQDLPEHLDAAQDPFLVDVPETENQGRRHVRLACPRGIDPVARQAVYADGAAQC
jgi:hypothetical protein